jgi:hypothetical protein
MLSVPVYYCQTKRDTTNVEQIPYPKMVVVGVGFFFVSICKKRLMLPYLS